MKLLRAFTAGVALLLAVLIVIFLLTLYVKFKPDEKKIENGISKPVQFVKSSQLNRDLVRITFFLVLSAAAALIFKRQPQICLTISVLLLAYDAQLIVNGQLTKRPMAITVLILAHVISAFALCAGRKGDDGRRAARGAGFAILGCSFVSAAYVLRYQRLMLRSSMLTAVLPDNSFNIPPQLRAYPDLIEMIVRKFENYGEEAARDLSSDFTTAIETGQMKLKFLNSINTEEIKAYTRFLLLVFAAVVLCAGLKRFRTLSALPAALPFVSVCYCAFFEKMTTLSLPLIVMTLAAFCCFAAGTLPDRAAAGDCSDFEDYEEDGGGAPADAPEYT